MCFQSQFPHKSVNLVRIPNKNTFSSAEIIERRIDLCPEASSRGHAKRLRERAPDKVNSHGWKVTFRSFKTIRSF
jgi:hypothetical protein